ncbi:MAG: transcription antiterminator [Anaerolineaceae bacterium]|nr:transcription antiterminator [Anaerolineaceae bacterium]
MRIYNRKDSILRALIENQEFINSDSLAQLIGVTSRTIRNDIKQLTLDLKEQNIELISIPGKGYQLHHQHHKKALTYYQQKQIKPSEIPSLPDDRQIHILGKLVFASKTITFETLADELFVSRSTIEKDFYEIEKWLSSHNLRLSKKPSSGVSIKGDEIALRYAMVNVLMMSQPIQANQHHPSVYEFCTNQELQVIKSTILTTQQENHLSLSDDDFNYLLYYIVISKFRLSNHFRLTTAPDENIAATAHSEFQIASEITAQLSDANGIELPLPEIANLAKTLQKIHLFDFNNQQVFGSIAEETLLELLKTKIAELSITHEYDFSTDAQLTYGLFFYLKSFLHKRNFKIPSRNNEIEDIKKEYPSALDLAVSISEMFNQSFHISLVEEDIAHMALYFCAAIERIELEKTIRPLKVAIICSSGIGASQLLAVKIRRYFPQLIIQDVFPVYRLQDAMQKTPDFIISTLPIKTEPIPNIVIGHVLNDYDFFRILNFIRDFHQSAHDDDFQFFTKLFRPELFLANLECSNQEEVIQKLCDPLHAFDYVGPDFCKAVIAREKLFSTAIGNLVAIPHALSNQPSTSQIAVGILNKPILWGKDKVQLVFLLNLQSTSIDDINHLYEYFFDVIQSKNKIQKLLKAKSFDQFIELIK